MPPEDPKDIRPPKRILPIDNDVILPDARPSDQPDVILPGDREGDHQAPPAPPLPA
ncbi:hypothetical protein [Phreatobacter aquaticus]|uniref:hypothetical protein n=1 Tax=Phreatobacter aquaticus TaxID=2570229 RepID=UPI00143D57A6|nr:hypothetical protein [Phreatobacter aquaticus]